MIGIRRKLQRRTTAVVDNRALVVRLYPDHLELWQQRKRQRVKLDYAQLWRQATKQGRLFE